MRKLELDSLQAELSTLDALLARRTEKEDPLGWLQLTHRRADVAERLARMESDLPSNAEVAVFFGGTPVVGSRGIRADFAADAISHYQELVTKRMASQALGPLATRGPVPRRDISTMLVTDVVRGSFGFVLQENGEASEPIVASLQQTLEDVSNLLANIAAENPTAFEEAAETLDDRTLFAIRDFLRVLDDNGATLRLVEGDRELSFDSHSLHRGRERADATVIDETIIQREGVLFLVPDARRFELHPTAGPVLKGIVAADVIQRNGEDEHRGAGARAADIVGKRWLVELQEKTVKQGSGKSRASYTLLRFIRAQS